MTHAKQSLGQNFLIDDNVIRKIIDRFSPSAEEFIVEIGPGHGALTQYLAHLDIETLAIEIDQSLVEELESEFTGSSSVRVRHQDILKTDFSRIASKTAKPVRVLGNIPYNITSPLLFLLLDSRKFIADAFLMVQKEIARRITAGPGTKDYGILSVLVQTYADARYEFGVSPHVFRPKPAVSSAVVSLEWNDRFEHLLPDPDLYRIVVRTAFGKRRKTLRNALEYLPVTRFDPDVLDFDTGLRAEALGVEEFIQLTQEIAGHYPDFHQDIRNSDL